MKKCKPLHPYNQTDLQYAFEMGFDAARNGANTTNCHFSIFSSPEKKLAWEHGQRIGKSNYNGPRGKQK